MPAECMDNCGCKVRIEHCETNIKCVKDDVNWMKKLMIGNLITAVIILAGVAINIFLWAVKSGVAR